MGVETAQVLRCTCWCGHSWLAEEMPQRCGKCKSRKWNVLVSSSQVEEQPVQVACAAVASKVVEPVVSDVVGSKVVVSRSPVVEPKKPAVKAPEQARSTAEKCPHGYQNYLVCRRFGGGC